MAADVRRLVTGAAGPTRDGEKVPGLDYYVVDVPPEQADLRGPGPARRRVPGRPRLNDGRGRQRHVLVNGHKFCFGKARAYQATAVDDGFAVAHNFFGQDLRIVAVDRDGKTHPCGHTRPGRTGPTGCSTCIDAEFDLLPPDRIKEYQVQFRPFEQAEIKDIALKPRTSGAIARGPGPKPRGRRSRAIARLVLSTPTADTDGDGLSDFQEIHKYRTDPREVQHGGRRRLRRRLAASQGVHLHGPVGRQGDAAGERWRA